MRALCLPSVSPGTTPADAFEAVVLAHHGDIHRFLNRVTGRASEAEDLAQETFLRAYRAFAGLPPDTNHRAWLYTIATNAFRNHLRSERRRKTAHATVRVIRRDVELDGPEAQALAGEARSVIEIAIRSLPVKQRLAFTMRKLEELDYESIGASLDCSAETARAHVFQALRKLSKIRNILDGHAARRARTTS
jgi:RNA polymerase sigma-70 factor (ECF subfamily)